MNDITPKEAIANLNHIYGMVAPDIQRSLDVAIKALERPTGDCISRSVLDEIRQLYKKYQPNLATEVIEFGNALEELIDNAQTVHQRDNYDLGYVQGLEDMKSDIITLIANEYTSHGELIPNWLTIGETKVSDRQKRGGVE